MLIYENRASYILYNIIKKTDLSKKIIVPANICPIVIATLLKAKKAIEVVDINSKDYHMDTNKVVEMISSYSDIYDSILFVRTYGADLDFNSFFDKLKSINEKLFIIDDKCLGIPELEIDITKNVDVTLFSTGYSKYVELGFGGYAFVRDTFLYSRTKLSYNELDHEILTDKFRDVINGNENFEYNDTNWLDSSYPKIKINEYLRMISGRLLWVHEHKEKINQIYLNNLPEQLMMGNKFNNWRFNLIVENKEEILYRIFESGLFASSHYSPINKFLGIKTFPVAESLYSKVLNLFNDFRFDEGMAHKIVEIINRNWK